MEFRSPLIAAVLILSCNVAFSETCQEKVNSAGAYRYSHSLPVGNGVIECYVIAKDGSGEPIKDSVVFEDTTLPENGAKNPDNSTTNHEKSDQKKEKICAEEHKAMLECFEYESRGMTLKNYADARKKLVSQNPGQKLAPKEGETGAEADQCETVGKHWNFYAKKDYKGSILCCECCRNSDQGPVIEDRCKVSGH